MADNFFTGTQESFQKICVTVKSLEKITRAVLRVEPFLCRLVGKVIEFNRYFFI